MALRYAGFEIYTPDFKNRHEITHAISITTSLYYNDVGKITVVLPIDKENIKIAQNNSLILDKSTWTAYIVQNCVTETDGDRITMNGYTADYLLGLRVVPERTKVKNIESETYAMINKNLRGLPRVKTAPLKGLTETTDSDMGYGKLLTKVKHLLDRGNLGRRMVWNDKEKDYTFEIYKGQDLTTGIHSVAFSYEYGSAESLTISDDISMLRTTFYASGKTLDEKRIVEVLGDEITGEERKEKWVKDVLVQESGTTEAEFRRELKERAQTEAEKYIRRTSFSVSVDPEEFGTRYKLGDIVNCISTTFGVKFSKRVTGVAYTIDDTGEKTTLTLGEPTITIIEEMMDNDGD